MRASRFESVQRYQGLARAERQSLTTRLVFFLCAPTTDVRTLKPMAYVDRAIPVEDSRAMPAPAVIGLLLTALAPVRGERAPRQAERGVRPKVHPPSTSTRAVASAWSRCRS